MDYATAKKIIAELAPDIVVGPDTGAAHLVLLPKQEEAAEGEYKPVPTPFSIMLPADSLEDFQRRQRAEFEQSIKAAVAHFGG